MAPDKSKPTPLKPKWKRCCSCGRPSALPSGGECRECMARWLTSLRNALAWEGRS